MPLHTGIGLYLDCAGGGGGEAPADFIAFDSDGSGVIKALIRGQGAVTFSRPGTATVDDFEGIIRTVPANCLRPELGRIAINLASGLVTETITVINGAQYQLTIRGDNGATAVCSGAFTGTLTADGVNRISWPNGTPQTSGSTSLTITVTGTLTEMLLEDVTGQANQNPSENVSATQEHGLVANGVKAFDYENNNTVDGAGVVSEAKGAKLTTEWRFLFEPGDDAAPMFDIANANKSEGTYSIDMWWSAGGFNNGINHNVWGLRNSAVHAMYERDGNLRVTTDSAGTNTPISSMGLADTRYRGVLDFKSDSFLDVAVRNVDASQAFQWNVNRPNPAGELDDVSNVFNIAFNLNSPRRLRRFVIYKTQKGRQWVEDNL